MPEKTGVFYHPSFSKRSYLTVGNRLADFPDALDPLLESPRIEMFQSSPVSMELLLKIHEPHMIEAVRSDGSCGTAFHSAGGVVEASERVAKGDILNAFSFIGSGGHHAGKNYFWGACCFNDVVLAIVRLRELGLANRFAILDTDAHHGDGTRELVMNDPHVLHLCCCDRNWESPDGLKQDFDVTLTYQGGKVEEEYMAIITEIAVPKIEEFNPDLFFWYFGFDTCSGDYGSLGLSKGFFVEMGRRLVDMAYRRWGGKMHVVLAGGANRETATWLIPRVIQLLAQEEIL